MRIVLAAALTALILAGCGGGPSTGEGGSQQAHVDALMEASGLNRQLAQIPDRMRTQFLQQKGALPEKAQERAAEILGNAFEAQSLHKLAREEIGVNYNAAHAVAVLDFLNTPLGKKVTEMEVHHGTPAGQEEYVKFKDMLSTNKPSEARMNLVGEFNEAARLSEQGLEMVISMVMAMISGMAEFAPREKQPSEEQIKAVEDRLRKQFTTMIIAETMTSLLHTYKELPDAEFKQMIDFYKTDAGKWFTGVVFGAFQRAMTGAGLQFSREMQTLAREVARPT